MLKGINPAYLYSFLGTVVALAVGLGLTQLTTLQTDLIMKCIAGAIALIWGVAVPTAGAVNQEVDDAYTEGLHTPVPAAGESYGLYSKNTKGY